MDSKQLEKIGFSKNESKIYLSLIEHGPLMAGAISKKTQINRRTTYDTIERLIEKGYVSYSIEANRKVFKAVNPSIIIDKLEEKEREAKKIVPDLQKLFDQTKENADAEIYRGRKGIRSILFDILKEPSYDVFGSNIFPDILKHDFLIFQKKKKELKIKSRMVVNKSVKKHPMFKETSMKCRFIKDEFSSPTSTYVYGNKIAIIILSPLMVGLVVENKSVATSFKNYFETLWGVGEK
jgi:HTH-type transcriptional regulator, sugar sensing transcriptional regulator